MAAEHLIITGKSGAGVSTTAVNLSAALAEHGYRVAHLGYDRRHLSSALLRGDSALETGCGFAGEAACQAARLQCAQGYRDILCVECGAAADNDATPEFGALCRLELLDRYRPDFVVHDISGEPTDVLPFLRTEGEAARVIVVVSADFGALTTLNLFLEFFAAGAALGWRYGGLVGNNITGSFFESIVDDFLRRTGTSAFASIPHSLMVSAGEYLKQSVVESAPQSHLSSVYRKLARLVAQGLVPAVPQPFPPEAFAGWLQKWSEITEELECGLVRDGAAI
ncbi:nitrogenase iron protein [Geomonas silvestris]|uniref:Nitrogenase iron protein n=1 Tax=Geomonas silvestris TaxID=2740184 RepID=A0A6V8MMU0_9BACT|nr:ATPase [Geomonas silvestris]GFO61345.1 nitrogenase iron protein [Geomonas silvestris]